MSDERDYVLCDRMADLSAFWKANHSDYLVVKCVKCGEDCMITPAGRKIFDPATMDPICPKCFREVKADVAFILHPEIEDEMRADAFKFIHRN